jgi:hypothetical protein
VSPNSTGLVPVFVFEPPQRFEVIVSHGELMRGVHPLGATMDGIIGRAAKPGLYANINAKRERIAAGSNERMRKPGAKGAPTNAAFKAAAKTAKK